MDIYINKDGQQYGPYTLDQVNEYLAQGSLQTTDPAWHDGLAEWCPLSQIAGVVDPSSPTPPSFDPTTYNPNAAPPLQLLHHLQPRHQLLLPRSRAQDAKHLLPLKCSFVQPADMNFRLAGKIR